MRVGGVLAFAATLALSRRDRAGPARAAASVARRRDVPRHRGQPSAGRSPGPPARRRGHRRRASARPMSRPSPPWPATPAPTTSMSSPWLQFGTAPRVIYPDIPDNYRTRLELQWPVYTSGRSDALERAAQAEALATGADLEVVRLDLRLEVARAYWALVTARDTVRVLEAALATADRSLADVRNLVEAGLLPPNDVSRSEAQRARQELLLIEARGRVESLIVDLDRLLGLPDGTPIEPTEGLETPAPPARDADTLVDEALKQRPELAALAGRTQAVEARITAIAADKKPFVAVGLRRGLGQPQFAHLPAPGQVAGVVGRVGQRLVAALRLGPERGRAHRGAVPDHGVERATRRDRDGDPRRRAEAAHRAAQRPGRAGAGPPRRHGGAGDPARGRRSLRGRRGHDASTSSTRSWRCCRPSSTARACWRISG